MLNVPKFYTSDGMVHFMGCFHYGHDKEFLWGKRGYKSIDEHDTDLIRKWNDKVDDDDTVFLLGDTLFGHNGRERILNLIRVLKGDTFYILPGNHHGGFKQLLAECLVKEENRPSYYRMDEYGRICYGYVPGTTALIYLVPNYFEIYVDKQPIVLSHFPIRCWNSCAKGAWMLHSHVHGNLEDSLPDSKHGKILDCGVESVKGPISFIEVSKIMKNKDLLVEDHHTSQTLNPF